MKAKKHQTKDGFNLGHTESLIQLLKWMRKCGFVQNFRMRPAYFTATERGLQVLQNVPRGSVIVSIPIKCCVTRYYLSKSWLGGILKDNFSRFSTQALMSAWLAVLTTPPEHISDHVPGDIHTDFWRPYIDSLPTEYSLPVQFAQEEIDSLPDYISSIVQKQSSTMLQAYTDLLNYLPSLNFKRFVWGYSTVNTRAVYLQRDPRDPGSGEQGGDCLALVPFLDLLNHSDNVTVEAGINLDSDRLESRDYFYELKVGQSVNRYSEAFICYGRHSNTKLLTEYGFSLGENNNSEHIAVTVNTILEFLQMKKKVRVSKVEEKLCILKENGLISNLGIGRLGLNWTAKAVLYILLLRPSELKSWHSLYQLENFSSIHSFLADFLEYFLEGLQLHLRKMAEIILRSKYFNLAEDLVRSHVKIVKLAITNQGSEA